MQVSRKTFAREVITDGNPDLSDLGVYSQTLRRGYMSRQDELISLVWGLTHQANVAGFPIYPGQIAELIRLARSLHRLSEHDCNRGLTDAEQKREARLMTRVDVIAAEIGATAYHQGDPRGASVWLIFPGDVPTGADVRAHYTNGIAIY